MSLHTEPASEPSSLAPAELFKAHAGWLCGILGRRFGSNVAAEDVVQEAFLRVSGAVGVRHPRALLLQIASRLAIDQLRRQRHADAYLAAQVKQARSYEPEQDEALLLKQLLSGLPEVCRETFLLSRFEGLSYEDIAVRQGISVKGVGVVIPNLLNWSGSAVVLDIKRENFDITAGFRSRHGQAVHLFDPLAADGRTSRYNPLGHIDRHAPATVLDELQKIAAMLFPSESGKSDPFWSEAARTGFIGVGAYVAETTDLPFSLGQIFRELTQGSPKLRFPGLIADRARAGRPLSSGCVSALTDFCAASDNTFASIRQTITSRMGLWLNPLVDAATSASDFDLRTFRSRKTTLYLAASPDNLGRVAPLYNLLFQQLVDISTRRRPGSDETGQVLLVLDEFARLGHAGVLAHGFSFVAGYGLRILAVLQSPSQLRAEYGQDLADEIVANCGVEIAFTPKELRIANELSERLGAYTYEGRSRSRPSGLSSGRSSQTESEQRRALMLPQELLQMPKDQLLVLRSGIPPVRGKKIVYYRDRAFTRRLSPAPVVAKLSDTETQGRRIQAIALEVASLRDVVEDIRTRVVERPMSAAEAAGETPLSADSITLALEDADMASLPEATSATDVRRFMREYAARASLPAADEDLAPVAVTADLFSA